MTSNPLDEAAEVTLDHISRVQLRAVGFDPDDPDTLTLLMQNARMSTFRDYRRTEYAPEELYRGDGVDLGRIVAFRWSSVHPGRIDNVGATSFLPEVHDMEILAVDPNLRVVTRDRDHDTSVTVTAVYDAAIWPVKFPEAVGPWWRPDHTDGVEVEFYSEEQFKAMPLGTELPAHSVVENSSPLLASVDEWELRTNPYTERAYWELSLNVVSHDGFFGTRFNTGPGLKVMCPYLPGTRVRVGTPIYFDTLTVIGRGT